MSHKMISLLLIQGLFIFVFMLQQNDGCLIILQMSFSSHLYGRCYLLPEQLSKDQSGISKNQNELYWVTFLNKLLCHPNLRFSITDGKGNTIIHNN
jgi:hypothetical protein